MRNAIAGACLAGLLWAAAALPLRGEQQDLDLLRGTDAPPNAIWIDSLDLSKMVQRRQTPRAGRVLVPVGIVR